MEEVPNLPDQYLDKAREMVAQQRKSGRCKTCYDRGYLGTNQQNMLIPCNKCVDEEELLKEWRQFVKATPELAELYGDYFEEDEEAGEEGDEAAETSKGKQASGEQGKRGMGQQRQGKASRPVKGSDRTLRHTP